MAKFERFATLKDMMAFAVAFAAKHENKVYVETNIYSDDMGVTHRPELALVDIRTQAYVVRMRWNAFTDEMEVSHIGKNAKREARKAGEWFEDQIQEELNKHYNAALDDPIDAMIDDIRANNAQAKPVETIDMTPTWSSILPVLLVALEDGSDAGKDIARAELKRMAQVADNHVASVKELQRLDAEKADEEFREQDMRAMRDALENRHAIEKATPLKVDAQELATILAALCFYQESGMGDPDKRSDSIHAIATNCDSVVSMDDKAIDRLIERLNMRSGE